MILYNVTINIDDSIHDEWVEWMMNTHIPAVIQSGCFIDYKIYRMVQPEDEEGTTYSVQYFADELEDYERYQIEHAAILQAEHNEKYKGKFTAFRSVLEEVL